ncbi:MAG: diphthamide synthesis protein [Candidatus Altiarchaeota archaeon]|nr:diphthamide synthesis protein [Candidatus Altiarchaeota archaeon]
MKTLFIPCHSKRDPLPVVDKALEDLRDFKRVGLITTAQHVNQLEKIRDFLLERNKEVFVGGQILGCELRNALKIEDDVDVFLYIGSGRFHPLGVSLSTKKPVVVANPLSDSVDWISDEEKKRWLGRGKGRVARAMDVGVYGILVSTKTGQFNLDLALKVRDELVSKGKTVFLFAGDEITPERVLGFKVDAWVNTACPRIIDDFFEKPVLNPDELEFVPVV